MPSLSCYQVDVDLFLCRYNVVTVFVVTTALFVTSFTGIQSLFTIRCRFVYSLFSPSFSSCDSSTPSSVVENSVHIDKRANLYMYITWSWRGIRCIFRTGLFFYLVYASCAFSASCIGACPFAGEHICAIVTKPNLSLVRDYAFSCQASSI